MACVNSRFASVSESKIVKIKDDSEPENTKKATNSGLKVFKDKWRSHVLQTSVFQFVYRDNYCDQFDLSLNRQQLIFTTTICLITSIFVDWFAWQNEFLTEIEEIEKEELKFYISARKQDRSYYNKATLTSIRAAIDRHLRNEPNNKPFSITSKTLFDQLSISKQTFD